MSRKTNTTTHEVLGVMTKGDTQIVCILFLVNNRPASVGKFSGECYFMP